MSQSAMEVSREFFREVVKPILEREFPKETAQTAFGLFGWGSEAYELDDAVSRDHHWGLCINAMMPHALFEKRHAVMANAVGAKLPAAFRGFPLRQAHLPGKGIAIASLKSFLTSTIGMDRAPKTDAEWLRLPEEDILHVINGEVWHDPKGTFTAIRRTLQAYYPEPVRLRRIAHWCRYFSGMGSYALKRAIVRDNEFYAATAFGKAIRWGVQLAFLLDRQYFPYDKWLMAFFRKLPRLARPLLPLVEEAVKLGTPWNRKQELLEAMADILDQTMVADGILAPHPKFIGSATSGCRVLEHAYAELIKKLPAEIKTVVPVWDQIYLEQMHSGYVDGVAMSVWHEALNLKSR